MPDGEIGQPGHPIRKLGWGRGRVPATARTARGFWVISGCGLLAVSAFAISVALDLGGTHTTDYVDNLGQLLAPLIAAGACFWAAFRAPGARAAWALLGASSLSWALGQAVWCDYDLLRRVVVPFPSLADVGYLGAVPLAVAGLLAFPSALRRIASRMGALLDGLLISGSLLFVSWSTVLGPIYRSHHGGILKQVLSMAYPASDVVLVSLVVVLAMHTGRSYRSGLSFVMLGIIAFAISDSSFAYFTQLNDYGIGNVLDTGWVAGYLLIGIGAVRTVSMSSMTAGPDPEVAESESVTMSSVLTPYALAALAGVVATGRLIQGRPFGIFLSLEGLVLLAMLGIRQIVTMVDNVSLNRRLFVKVELGTKELRAREARYSALVERSSDPITIIKDDATIVYQSPSLTRLLGWKSSDAVGTSYLNVLHPEDHERWNVVLQRLVAEPGNEVTTEWRLLHLNGSWRTFESVLTNLIDEPSVGGLVLDSRDVTDQRIAEAQLRHQAFHDPLTGLANRSLFAEHLDRAVRRRGRSGGGVQVMVIDLDNFKAVNDLRGRALGDELLRQVARRLENTFRDADVIARMGGDQFAVLSESPPLQRDSRAAADRLLARFAEPFELGTESVMVAVCVGVATDATGAETDEELMRHADLAVNSAKSKGKQSCAVYTAALHDPILENMRVETELRCALERDELVVHYQPIVDVTSGRVAGVEALVRWNHPERGLVGPYEFISIAESSGLIVPIGDWVLNRSCREVHALTLPRGETLRLSVNVSPRQLSNQRFFDEVENALKSSAFEARLLTLEVTESLFVDDVAGRLGLLNKLRGTHVQIAIDDFGTGYSSLKLLGEMPVDILKIDKSFIDHVVTSPESGRLVQMILHLAKDLGLRTVAEGVEDQNQLETLQKMGCQLIQGYYFSRPIPVQELQTLLQVGFPALGNDRKVAV
jgi:diguanylate cyclase (GGDEF)-like protein/PAS domain S-box-containing protein